jgi:hypothetical protein
MARDQAYIKKKNLISSAFCSVQASDGLDDAFLHWRNKSILLSSVIQMLVLSRNSISDTRRSIVYSSHPISHSGWPIKLSTTSSNNKILSWEVPMS